jgi:hypothetical protein
MDGYLTRLRVLHACIAYWRCQICRLLVLNQACGWSINVDLAK